MRIAAVHSRTRHGARRVASSQAGAAAEHQQQPEGGVLLSAANVAALPAKLQDGRLRQHHASSSAPTRPSVERASRYRMAVDRRRPPQKGSVARHRRGECGRSSTAAAKSRPAERLCETKKGEQVDRRIEGGTVHKVSKGDFLLIPGGRAAPGRPASAPSSTW